MNTHPRYALRVFGTPVGLLAGTPRQVLFAHRHAGGIGADIQDGHRRTAGLGWALLPRLGRSTHPLHHSLNLSRGHVNAAGFGQVLPAPQDSRLAHQSSWERAMMSSNSALVSPLP